MKKLGLVALTSVFLLVGCNEEALLKEVNVHLDSLGKDPLEEVVKIYPSKTSANESEFVELSNVVLFEYAPKSDLEEGEVALAARYDITNISDEMLIIETPTSALLNSGLNSGFVSNHNSVDEYRITIDKNYDYAVEPGETVTGFGYYDVDITKLSIPYLTFVAPAVSRLDESRIDDVSEHYLNVVFSVGE